MLNIIRSTSHSLFLSRLVIVATECCFLLNLLFLWVVDFVSHLFFGLFHFCAVINFLRRDLKRLPFVHSWICMRCKLKLFTAALIIHFAIANSCTFISHCFLVFILFIKLLQSERVYAFFAIFSTFYCRLLTTLFVFIDDFLVDLGNHSPCYLVNLLLHLGIHFHFYITLIKWIVSQMSLLMSILVNMLAWLHHFSC